MHFKDFTQGHLQFSIYGCFMAWPLVSDFISGSFTFFLFCFVLDFSDRVSLQPCLYWMELTL